MKILTKEEEAAHYNATLKGGVLGGVFGLGVGAVGVLAASRRYHFFRQLTLPLKAFLVTSSGTFAGIVSADQASHNFEKERNPIDQEYQQREKEIREASVAGKSFTERAVDFGRKERYKIVAASWVASMFAAFAIVNRNKYLTGQQKLVQARVYAQFLTVGVLVATAAFEISDSKNETGRYETVRVLDPNDPEHKRYIEKQKQVESSDGDSLWKDMVAAEEQRLKERDEDEDRIRKEHHKKSPKNGGSSKDKKGKDAKTDKNGSEDGDDKQQKKDDGKDGNKQKKDDKQGGDEGKGTKQDKSAENAKSKK